MPFHMCGRLAAAIAAVFVAGSAATALAETVLRFNVWLPPSHPMVTQVWGPLANEVAAATQGRVKVEFTPASLAPPQRQFDLVLDGVADLAWTNHGYEPSRFKLAKMVELPFLGDSAEALSVAYWRVHHAYLTKANEHKGLHLVSLNAHGPGPVFSTKRPIVNLEDFDGLKLIVTGGYQSDIVRVLSGSPLLVPPPQWFEMISRGVADGALIGIDGPMKFKLEKHLPHITTFPGGLFNTSFAAFTSEKRWQSLPAEDRAALADVFGEALSRKTGQVWDASEQTAIARFAEAGIQANAADAALVERVRALTADLEKAWVADAAAAGIEGAAALAALREMAAHEQTRIGK